MLVVCGPDGFEFVDHDGRTRASLGATQLAAVAEFRTPTTIEQAWTAHREQAGPDALTRDAFDRLVRALAGSEVIVPYDPHNRVQARLTRQAERMKTSLQRRARVLEAFDRLEDECDRRGARRAASR